MSIYQRGENWYVDFTFKGQRIRESIGPSRKDAEKVIAKRKTEIVENKYFDIQKEPELIGFHEFAVDYLELTKPNKKESSWSREISVMRRLDKRFGKRIFQQITTDEIERYKIKRLRDGVMPATINRELALLKTMFTKALEWDKLKENPAKKVKLLDGEIERVRYLMPDEINRLLSNCNGTLRAIVTVAVNTGLRKGELLGLLWQNVNLDLGIISILRTDTKNKTRRDIPMNEAVKITLKAMERRGPFVFCREDGKPFQNSGIRKSFEKAVKESGITDFRFHDLRHTFASNLVMAGVDILKVKELLGHKELKMTLRYTHLSPHYMADAINILDERFNHLSQIPPQKETEKKDVWASA